MKTKIFATFGPSCKEEKILKEMIKAGVTGMRLNLSHTALSASESYIRAYENAAKSLGVKPEILIDMQGPELRVGDMAEALELKEGQQVLFVEKIPKELQEDIQSPTKLIPVEKEVIMELKTGAEVLLDDGKILVQIIEVAFGENNAQKGKGLISGKVLRGGILLPHKSIKIKDKNVKMPALTAHDIENIKVAGEYGVTALMQPFVLSGEDLKYVRSILKENQAEHIKIYAKIENRLGVEHLQDILPEADVLIIARGDLGNDMPLWELPRVQKEIETACKEAGKPYIVVTQMLASMEKNPVPTRAEVSDIFHAVYHGAWGVMITGETAVGKYPVEAVSYLAQTAKTAEQQE